MERKVLPEPDCEHMWYNKLRDDEDTICVKCDWSPDPIPRRAAIYGGPNRSGVCKCGHSWEDHHLGMVVRPGSYLTVDGHREFHIPQECEHFGFNEVGGLKYNKKSKEWEDHCFGYRDSMLPDLEVLGTLFNKFGL